MNDITSANLTFKAKKLVLENWLQLYRQQLSVSLTHTDLDAAYTSIVQLSDFLKHADPLLIDDKHHNTLAKTSMLIRRFIMEDRASARTADCNVALDKISDLLSVEGEDVFIIQEEAEHVSNQRSGEIKKILLEKRFGFIIEDNGSEWFFHRNHLEKPNLFERLIPGTRVCFAVGNNEKGPCAIDVAIAEEGV